MSFVLKDFQAGFALGRALWKPPRTKTDIDTGFGWTADPACLIYNAGTFLGQLGGFDHRYFYKTENEWAVSAWSIHREPSGWNSPVLISTSQDAVKYICNETQLGVEYSFEYLGKTWYSNGQYALSGGEVVDSANRPIVDCQYHDYRQSMIDVLQAAHVRLTGGA